MSNTTISRPLTLKSGHKTERGGLSGEPLKELATQTIRDMHTLTNGGCLVLGVSSMLVQRAILDKGSMSTVYLPSLGAELFQVVCSTHFQAHIDIFFPKI